MAHSKLYVKLMNSARWRRLRDEWIREHPLCEECKRKGIVEPARCVHHITPIESGRNDKQCEDLAFSRANLQALCYQCHADIHKAENSHSKEAHKQRAQERLQQWIARHKRDQKATISRTTSKR